MKRALITGISGQDGSYLAELLLAKGYSVFGLILPGSSTENLLNIIDKIELIEGDVANKSSVDGMMQRILPDEVYNLAAPSFLEKSSANPIGTTETIALGTMYLLESLKQVNPSGKFFQSSSSEMYGLSEISINKMCIKPRNPYGIAKIFAHCMVMDYRNRQGLFACNGILFNHESPRRKKDFVTRKITDGVARIKLGLSNTIILGNLDSRRDWGFAGDYVEAMWLTLQQDTPDDYIIATGETHSVEEFLIEAFLAAGISDWRKYVQQDHKYMRPVDVPITGDPTETFKKLNWKPKISFKQLVKMMVDEDIKRLSS